MTVSALLLGAALLGSAVVIGALLLFFSRKVEIGAKALADLTKVKGEHAALEELVYSLIKRQAGRSERKTKKAQEEEIEDFPVDVRERIASGTYTK